MNKITNRSSHCELQQERGNLFAIPSFARNPTLFLEIATLPLVARKDEYFLIFDIRYCLDIRY